MDNAFEVDVEDPSRTVEAEVGMIRFNLFDDPNVGDVKAGDLDGGERSVVGGIEEEPEAFGSVVLGRFL